MPTANSSRKPRLTGSASRRLLQASLEATSKPPPFIGTISISTMQCGCSAKDAAALGTQSLYAYEAGAIYENQRDYAHAIDEYVKGALSGAPESSAELRLLELARRPKFRDLIERSTAGLAPTPNPPMAAVYLRVKVLEVQNRKEEMSAFLDSIANSTTSIEQAEDIETLAQQKSLEGVRQDALEKQAALTTDPVTRLQLRYQLIRPLREP